MECSIALIGGTMSNLVERIEHVPNKKCISCEYFNKHNHFWFPLEVCSDCIYYALREDNYTKIKPKGN